jgi:uncharacterized protein involved in exopolysaccharide biosynthesis
MQYELNLRDYIRIFYKRKFLIIGTFILVLFATFYNISQQPYVYEAVTTVKIEQRKSIAGLLTEWIMYNPEDVMETETKIIRGFPIMEEVAKKLGKVTDKMPAEEARGVIGGLQGSIETRKVENTNIIEIICRGGNPKEVAELANTTALVYIDQNLKEKTKQARAARQFIQDQLAAVETRLVSAEEELRSLGGDINQVGSAGPIQSRVVELQFELSALMQKYTDKHPRVIQLKRQIEELGF